MKPELEDISDILTKEGRKKIKVGQYLAFNFEGSRNEYKVVRKARSGEVWVRPVITHLPEDVTMHDDSGSRSLG